MLAVQLPLGVWMEGSRCQEATLRPLTGADEVFLMDAREIMAPAERLSALLDRCLLRLGPKEPVPAGTAASLTVGDREALALHLRRAAFGNRLQALLPCPQPECGEKMDLEIQVSDLLVPPIQDHGEIGETSIDADGTPCRVRFRLPTGADQEAIATEASRDPQGAAERLMARCIERIEREDGQLLEDLPGPAAQRVETLMSELDPQAELILDLACPSCGRAFVARLDAADFLFRELADRAPLLARDVHLLARYYHWSEADILGMPVKARRRYADFLATALGGEELR